MTLIQPIGGRLRSFAPKGRTLVPVAKAPRTSAYRDLLEAAERLEPGARKVFLDVLARARGRLDVAALRRALTSGDQAGAFKAVQAALGDMSMVAGPFVQAFEDGFRIARGSLMLRDPTAFGSLNLTNQRSLRFLETYRMNLIRGINRTTEEGIREVVDQAFRSGGHPYRQATEIREMIGLLPSHARAVENYRNSLIGDGMSSDKAAGRVARYADQLLTYRARNIARTETLRASNRGQTALWDNAADEGLIDRRKTRKVWILTEDERLCPVCESIPGQNKGGVPIDREFYTDSGPVEEPPVHPSCRCTVALEFD